MDEEPVTWGWDDFFSDLARFLSRQAGIASVSYAEYAIERLEMCIGVCAHLLAVLDAGVSVVEGEEREEDRHTFLILKQLLRSGSNIVLLCHNIPCPPSTPTSSTE